MRGFVEYLGDLLKATTYGSRFSNDEELHNYIRLSLKSFSGKRSLAEKIDSDRNARLCSLLSNISNIDVQLSFWLLSDKTGSGAVRFLPVNPNGRYICELEITIQAFIISDKGVEMMSFYAIEDAIAWLCGYITTDQIIEDDMEVDMAEHGEYVIIDNGIWNNYDGLSEDELNVALDYLNFHETEEEEKEYGTE